MYIRAVTKNSDTMKKLSTLFFLSIFALSLYGQKNASSWANAETDQSASRNFMYNFSVSTGAYSDLTGSTLLSQGQVWDDPAWIVPLGFNFSIMNVTGGFLTFDVSTGGSVGIFNVVSPDMAGILSPFDADLLDRGSDQGGTSTAGLSPISYKVDGTAPYRIFKLEWNNCGSYNELWDNNSMNEYVNFQLWIYETGIIEFRFGPQSITNTTNWYEGLPGILSGLAVYDIVNEVVSNVHLLIGSPATPQLSDQFMTLTGHPTAGLIYRFEPLNIGLEDELKSNLALYPNPTKDALYISGGDLFAPVTILDMSGRVITEGNLENGKIYLGNLSSGVYFIQVENEVLKFVKH